jgi:hypothetical protein
MVPHTDICSRDNDEIEHNGHFIAIFTPEAAAEDHLGLQRMSSKKDKGKAHLNIFRVDI